MTGELSLDIGLVGALQEMAAERNALFTVHSHEQSMLAGALGAAIWGAFRTRKLAAKGLSFGLQGAAA